MSEKKWLASDGKTELRPFDKVLVRDDYAERWKCNFLSYKIDDRFCPFRCIDRSYSQCFPYKGNEDHVGTDSSIPEPRQDAPQPDKPLEWGEWVIVQADNGQTFKGIYVGIEKAAGRFCVILEGCMAVSYWEYCKRA